jgi:hypothetical protein
MDVERIGALSSVAVLVLIVVVVLFIWSGYGGKCG